MLGIITSVVTLINQFLPLIEGTDASANIEKVVDTLTKIVPVAVAEGTALLGPIKGIVAALNGNPAATPEQLATLKALDQVVDDAFDAAAGAAGEGPI